MKCEDCHFMEPHFVYSKTGALKECFPYCSNPKRAWTHTKDDEGTGAICSLWRPRGAHYPGVVPSYNGGPPFRR